MQGFPPQRLVVSPHLDDAVLSCGEMIAEVASTVVLTVFAGVPAGFEGLTGWDRISGFQNAQQAVAARRGEDRAALDILLAQPCWLDFCDGQYARSPSLALLACGLDEVLAREAPATVVIPAGLGHPDHILAHQALLMARRHHLDKTWLMYEDALYRRTPGLLQQRLRALMDAGIEATPLPGAANGATQLKSRAVECYRSQLLALSKGPDGYADAFAPERFWRLEAGPAVQGARP